MNMATDKKGVIVYADWIDKFEELNDDEAGRLIKHFFRYVNDLNPEAPDRITKISFIDIEKCLKRDLKKWETTLVGRSKAGTASAEARRVKKLAQQEATNSTNVKSVEKNPTNPTVNVNVNDNVKVKDIHTMFTHESFLTWFKECRQYLGLQYNVKRLSITEKQLFNELKDYTKEDFKLAFKNFSNDKYWSDNNLLLPSYFLKSETFTKYLNAEVKKELTLGEKLIGKTL